MAKGKKSIFFCQNCGHEEAKWLGQCPACKEWNTFVEERRDRDQRAGPGSRRRDCTGITGTGRRRSGNWKVNTFITGMSKNGTDEKDPVYFRRGVAGTD